MMRSERKKQVITLSILLASVLVISVGFAVLSSTLKIKSNATVNPNSTDFKVVLSSNPNTLETNRVKASPEDMGSDATIDNTSIPTISGLVAKTRIPGDSVTYTFYVRNEGHYEAFLNSITYSDKICMPASETSVELMNDACDSIKAIVNVGSITTTETQTNITGESLMPGESKQVTVTLSYDSNGARADGPFTVEFGEISMYYASSNGMNEDSSELAYTGEIYRASGQSLFIGNYINPDNRWCAVVPGIASSCVYNDYINQVFSSESECQMSLNALANSGSLSQEEQYLVSNAVCEQETLSYEKNLSSLSLTNYLKHTIVSNKVVASYVCGAFIENGSRKDVCLKGGDSSYYELNKKVLRSAESFLNTLPGNMCDYYDYDSTCSSNYFEVSITSDGLAVMLNYMEENGCVVDSNGISLCLQL